MNAKLNLQDLIKKSKMTQSNANQGKQKGKPGQDDEAEVNIEALMDDIRRDIVNVYSVLGEGTALDAKNSIEVLHDVEVQLNEYMKIIKYINDENEKFSTAVQREEKKRKEKKTEEQKADRERQL